MFKDNTHELLNKKFGRKYKHSKNKNGFTNDWKKNLEKYKQYLKEQNEKENK